MSLTFFWRCEGTTLDPVADFSAADTTATANNSPAISATGARIGSNGLVFDGSSERYDFNPSSIITPSVGAIGGWFQFPSVIPGGAGACLFLSRGNASANDKIEVVTHSGGGASNRSLTLNLRHNTGGAISLTLTGNVLAPGNWYFYTAGWNSATPTRTLDVYDTAGTSLDSTSSSASFTANVPAALDSTSGIRYGDTTGTTGTLYLDNQFIGSSDVDTTDFWTYRAITTYADYDDGTVSPPTIISIDTDNIVTQEQQNVAVVCTDVDTATAELRQGGMYVYPLSIDSQSTTSVVFDMPDIDPSGGLSPHPGDCSLAVINTDTQEALLALVVSNSPDTSAVAVVSPGTAGTIELSPPAQSGDYVRWRIVGGTFSHLNFTLNPDMTYQADEGLVDELVAETAELQMQPWDFNDGRWGEWRAIPWPATGVIGEARVNRYALRIGLGL